MPVFFDAEIATTADLNLLTSLGVSNNFNFIAGNVNTPKTQPDIAIHFFKDAFYTGASESSKTNGYVRINEMQNFTFPVGDMVQLRPLILNSETVNENAQCSYFKENPNSPSSFETSFNTDLKSPIVGSINTTEFWRLEGTVPSKVSLSWNEQSNIGVLTDEVSTNTITVVGWSKTGRRWLRLGNTATEGNLTEGFVTSDTFIPDDYEIITIGSPAIPAEVLSLDNYLLTPNGDGLNDFLVIPEMESSLNNEIQIFDRFGLKVFESKNYTNTFNGDPNVTSLVIEQEKGLPPGVYFYLVELYDLQLRYQGFLYLLR